MTWLLHMPGCRNPRGWSMKFTFLICNTMLLLLTALLAGCAFPIEPTDQRAERTEQLTREILVLSPAIDWQEAHEFAKAAVETSAGLGKKYDVALRPWLHNASILVGLKARGLCYQYADDLYERLKYVSNEHLEMHYVAANWGHLDEHHALTVTVKDAPWDSGLVLDAWRRNGNLYFVPVKQDSYPWQDDGIAYFFSR